jgi:hypothetical protein
MCTAGISTPDIFERKLLRDKKAPTQPSRPVLGSAPGQQRLRKTNADDPEPWLGIRTSRMTVNIDFSIYQRLRAREGGHAVAKLLL